MALDPRLKEYGGDRDSFLDQLRTVPMQCSNAVRLIITAAGKLFAGEIVSTSDQQRVFLEDEIIAPVWHQEVASQAEMLALNEDSDRGVYRCDKVYRTDTETVWECIANNGEEIEEWIEYEAAGAAVAGAGQYFMLEDGTGQQMTNSAGETLYVWIAYSDITET